MKRMLLAALAAVAVSACSDKTEAPADAGAPPEAAAQKRLPLPECAGVDTEVDAEGKVAYTDCRGMFEDQSGLAFEARWTTEGDVVTETIQIVAPGDATLQTLVETMDGAGGPPSSKDVDGDGRLDLLVPRYQGMVNVTWAVWLQGADQSFKRAGELFGVDTQTTESGYIAAPSRSSAASWAIGFVKLVDGQLVPQATVDVTAQGEEDGTVTGWTCALSADAPLAEGLEPKAAEAQFCAEPVAAGIYQ